MTILFRCQIAVVTVAKAWAEGTNPPDMMGIELSHLPDPSQIVEDTAWGELGEANLSERLRATTAAVEFWFDSFE